MSNDTTQQRSAYEMLRDAMQNTPAGQLPANLWEITVQAILEDEAIARKRAAERARINQLASDYFSARKTLLSAIARKSSMCKMVYLPVVQRKADALLKCGWLAPKSERALRAEVRRLCFETEMASR